MLWLQYEWDDKERRIEWSDANFIWAIEDSINELDKMIGEEAGPRDAIAPSNGEHEDDYMENFWREQLTPRMQNSQYKIYLKTIIKKKFVRCGSGQVMCDKCDNPHMVPCDRSAMQ